MVICVLIARPSLRAESLDPHVDHSHGTVTPLLQLGAVLAPGPPLPKELLQLLLIRRKDEMAHCAHPVRLGLAAVALYAKGMEHGLELLDAFVW
mmetsp:Transcript_6930/g.20147  ORF Transcript_6930/g.20147 Transcript_6930/m.20147 type:complete len:94 (-) Transcript_6930:206-487(-)